ncbi:MAG: cytochrome C [Gammaproteobacteria bacterium]|nr:MAG: cytochrome C [Gammaproteobacteria bacterium]
MKTYKVSMLRSSRGLARLLQQSCLWLSVISVIGVAGLLAFPIETNAETLQEVMARKPDIVNGKKVYQLCATCHLSTGWGKKDGTFPVIASQHRNIILKEMVDVLSRKRQNPTMFPFIDPKLLGGWQSIADVAAYVDQLPPDPNPGTGSGENIKRGAEIYQQKCVVCHGSSAEGDNEKFYPRLRGQHYGYLKRELEFIQGGFRKNADPVMLTQLKTLSAEEIDAVADYLSRLMQQ